MRKKMRVYTTAKMALDNGFSPQDVLAAVADAIYAHISDALEGETEGPWAPKGIHCHIYEGLGDFLDWAGAERPAPIKPLVDRWINREDA